MPTLENTKNYYSDTKNVRTIEVTSDASARENVTDRNREITLNQTIVLYVLGGIFLLLIFLNLYVQHKDLQVVQEIHRYEQSVGELNSQAEGVQTEIYQQVNYDAVKQAAGQEKMTIAEERVRDIDNEE